MDHRGPKRRRLNGLNVSLAATETAKKIQQDPSESSHLSTTTDSSTSGTASTSTGHEGPCSGDLEAGELKYALEKPRRRRERLWQVPELPKKVIPAKPMVAHASSLSPRSSSQSWSSSGDSSTSSASSDSDSVEIQYYPDTHFSTESPESQGDHAYMSIDEDSDSSSSEGTKSSSESSTLSRSIPVADRSKEEEARRLLDMLLIVGDGSLSDRKLIRLLKVPVIGSKYSYEVLKRYIEKRSDISKHCLDMCPLGHCVTSGVLSSAKVCPTPSCGRKMGGSSKFWYSLFSEQLRALCKEPDSFREILNGCKRAQRAMKDNHTDVLYDYYDGELFRRLHGERMSGWDEDREIYVFLSISSDGFEVYKDRRGKKNTWPVVGTILNLDSTHRFRASNALITAFIPGKHDGEHFDSFLCPIVEDLRMLQTGFDVRCVDGKVRRLKAFLLFVTADFPAATKMLGFMGHNSKKPCRACHKGSEFVPESGGSYLLPVGNLDHQRMALRGRVSLGDGSWLDDECPGRRTSSETEATWEKLDKIERSGGPRKVKELMIRKSGIRRKPLFAKLTLDFVYSFPYDPMHLCLLGWVRHLLVLCIGAHKRTSIVKPGYVVSDDALHSINECLRYGTAGIPLSWGRPPLELDFLSNFKAEDFKLFGLFYGMILFSGNGIDERLTVLWVLTSKVLQIVLHPTPVLTDCEDLDILLQNMHALFCEYFYIDDSHAFCLTPTTHAVLHLAEFIRQCGPLLNVSQFLMERLVGEVRPMARSRVRPEANLLKKSHTMLCMRLLNGGLSERGGIENSTLSVHADQGTSSTSSTASVKHGKGEKKGGPSRTLQAIEYLRSRLYKKEQDWEMNCDILQHAKASVEIDGMMLAIETEPNFSQRKKRPGCNPRQICYIAANFAGAQSHLTDSEDSTGEDSSMVYYGCIKEIWEIIYTSKRFCDGHFEGGTMYAVRVDWFYGLARDRTSEMTYTNLRSQHTKGTIRDRKQSLENIQCIDRSIAYMDYQGKRYFIDPKDASLKNSTQLTLMGFRK